MAITHVSGFPSSTDNTPPPTPFTIPAPAHIGDLLVMFFAIGNESPNTFVSAISSANASGGWNLLSVGNDTTNFDQCQMAWAVATSTSSASATITYGGTTATVFGEIAVDSYTAGLGATTAWTVQAQGTLLTTTNSTHPLYPSLTSGAAGQLYVGYGYWNGGSISAGTTSGFTYTIAPISVIAYNASLAATTAYQPNSTQGSGKAVTCGVIFNAAAGTVKVNKPRLPFPTASMRSANFHHEPKRRASGLWECRNELIKAA